MQESLDAWFTREILSHEAILMRFLARVWPRREEHADIRQETYVRVYEAAQSQLPQNPRAFLFATARHLMADRIRRERIVSIQATGDLDFLNVLVDELTPEDRVSAGQELARLARAFDQLPNRCREVFWLRRIKEIPQKEVSIRLGVTEKAIEKQIATATRLIAQYMRANKLTAHERGDNAHANPDDESEDEQGTQSAD
jgi:RNA polymerase sigma-70 factor (ECF subfamily)